MDFHSTQQPTLQPYTACISQHKGNIGPWPGKLEKAERPSRSAARLEEPLMGWEFHTHTVGPIPHYLRARPQRTTRTRGPHHARHPASKATSPGSYPTSSHPLHTARPARPGTLTYTTHSHAPTARTGFAGAIRLHLRLLQTHPPCTALRAPNRPGPARARTADSDNARAELG